MSRPVKPRPLEDGPSLPSSVRRRRPAQVIPRQRAERLPPPPRVRARPLFERGWARRLPGPPPIRGRRPIPIAVVVAVLLFTGLFAVAAGLGLATDVNVADWFRAPPKPPEPAFPVLAPSRPVRLTIPAIDVDAPVMRVGLAADGSIAVPPLERHNQAGWFDRGPTPGQYGPAVIVGHVDTRSGPSVFRDLDRLRPGQRIEVLRRNGSTALFTVDSVEHFAKSALPVDRVYGDFSRPSLRLVTCGGDWDAAEDSYSDNVVVFAELSGSRDA